MLVNCRSRGTHGTFKTERAGGSITHVLNECSWEKHQRSIFELSIATHIFCFLHYGLVEGDPMLQDLMTTYGQRRLGKLAS